ncbi:uncharacterized protein LOC134230797 [Saccostrea cucullata]|uniref:uncharacterized protein LOC134230797 n=1 Tax=Saccostrea cuccullata TaxID=36930 RepID=UPI002ED54918
MEFYFILIMLFHAVNSVMGNKPGFCPSTSTGKLQCCENYRRVGETCEECWPGTYSWNCTPCPAGFYGRLCLGSCNQCTPCDPVTGCASPKSSSGFGGSDWWIKAAFGALSCGAGFTVFMLIYCKLRKRRSKERQDISPPDNRTNNTTVQLKRENKQLMNLQNQNGAIDVHCQQKELEYEPYDTINLTY